MSTTPSDLTEIRDAEIPTDDAPTTAPESAAEYGCVVCGVDVSHLYKRRVKEPRCDEHKKNPSAKRATGARKSGKDVDTAVAALDQMYSLLSMGLFAVGARHASSMLADSADTQKAINRNFLEMDPALAKRIASMGRTGGRYAFFASQAAMFGPILVNAYAELTNASTDRKAASEAQTEYPDDIPAMMGGVPL